MWISRFFEQNHRNTLTLVYGNQRAKPLTLGDYSKANGTWRGWGSRGGWGRILTGGLILPACTGSPDLGLRG